ncbi:hypothetical protein AAHE18_18G119400 [Arachis hypogaea]|nr:uncharacterized protein DS421_18g616970 [Arachis hypogaea]
MVVRNGWSNSAGLVVALATWQRSVRSEMETGVLPCSNLRRQWEERWSKGKGKGLRTKGRGLDAMAALGCVAMARRWWRLRVSGSAMGRLVRDGGSTLRGDARGR